MRNRLAYANTLGAVFTKKGGGLNPKISVSCDVTRSNKYRQKLGLCMAIKPVRQILDKNRKDTPRRCNPVPTRILNANKKQTIA